MATQAHPQPASVASKIHPTRLTQFPSARPPHNPLADFQATLLQIHSKRSSTQNGYELVISSL